ncbi:elongation of very long chain fatty acids protein [Apis mellifera caucasica]|uniref:Elongation of very long chain fatty acids protein n=1 Tax=Apis mellifera TaxID=7460 RepID=A0A7M7GK39_APIME|nr:elongation of very long chain fatty acids protein AAEL008004 [Apis mellifera]KAG6796218.1 elongation of very long chain fatty acids protein [Apis mellifera caucasica]KAG9427942.1 elongation of very long chain fatty acids protein [Apis mellifera carnica]|eukprot:XP_006557849.1 elongation of very long chain fatty acids protein AAEL008004 [Apis mellifera]
MSNLIHQMVNNCNEILDTNNKNKEIIIDTWPMMYSPGPILCIVGCYLAFVLKVGPKMMEKRSPFQLNFLLLAYNVIQVIFNIWLSLKALEPSVVSILLLPKCQNPTSLNLNTKNTISSAAWWYFIAKIMDLLDTVFFTLRKKQNQVTFLHVYHHTITSICSWLYVKFLPGQQGAVIIFLNSLVHVIMYTYYLISALGPKYKKYLWWKKYMTWIQLVQFFILLAYELTILVLGCKVPKALSCFVLTNLVIFIYLFSDFYRKAYAKQKV